MKLQRIVTSTVTTYLQRGFTALLSIACQIFSVDIIQNSLWRADRLLRIVEKGASVKKKWNKYGDYSTAVFRLRSLYG